MPGFIQKGRDFFYGAQEGLAGPAARAAVEASEARTAITQDELSRRDAEAQRRQESHEARMAEASRAAEEYRIRSGQRAADVEVDQARLQAIKSSMGLGDIPYGPHMVGVDEKLAKWDRIFGGVEGRFAEMSPEGRARALEEIHASARDEVLQEYSRGLEERLARATMPQVGPTGEELPPLVDEATAEGILQMAQGGDVAGAVTAWNEVLEANRKDARFRQDHAYAMGEMTNVLIPKVQGAAEFIPDHKRGQFQDILFELQTMGPEDGDPMDLLAAARSVLATSREAGADPGSRWAELTRSMMRDGLPPTPDQVSQAWRTMYPFEPVPFGMGGMDAPPGAKPKPGFAEYGAYLRAAKAGDDAAAQELLEGFEWTDADWAKVERLEKQPEAFPGGDEGWSFGFEPLYEPMADPLYRGPRR